MAQTKAQLLGPVVGDVVMDVSTLSLDAEGNKVGIGTTGATATLHVFEPTEGDAVVQFNSGDNFPTVNRGLVLKAATGPTGYTGSKWIFDAQSSGGRLEFQTVSTPRLTILESGNVGIGTSNPTQKLHVEGHVLAVDGSSGLLFEEINNGAALWLDGANGDFSGGDYYGIIANNNAQLQLGYAGDPDLVLTSAGLVGIGTNAPSAPLHVLSSSYPTTTIQRNHAVNYPRLRLINTSNHGADLDGIGDGSPAGGFRISTITGGTSTERLRISGDGQIGMGKEGQVTPNGNSPLTIQESDSNSETICLRATNSGGNGSQPGIVMKTAAGGHIGGIYCDVNSDYMRLSTSGNDAIYISNVGDVGIGYATPSQKLVVKGTTSLMATNSTNQWMAYTYTDNTFRLNYNGAGADEVTINSNGNIATGGEINVGGYDGGSTTTDGVLLGAVGGVYSQLAASAAATGVLWQGMHGSTFTSRIQASGAATFSGSVAATSVNLQSSSTSSWFQTGTSLYSTNYVWAAKNSSSNTWHSGLQTDGDLLLGNVLNDARIGIYGSSGNMGLKNATTSAKLNVQTDVSGNYTGWKERNVASGSMSQASIDSKTPTINDFTYPNSSNGMLIWSTSKIGFAAGGESPQYGTGVQMLFDSGGLMLGGNRAFDRTSSTSTNTDYTVRLKTNGTGIFKGSLQANPFQLTSSDSWIKSAYGAISNSTVSSLNNLLIAQNMRGYISSLDGGSANNNFYHVVTHGGMGYCGTEYYYGGVIKFFAGTGATTANSTFSPPTRMQIETSDINVYSGTKFRQNDNVNFAGGMRTFHKQGYAQGNHSLSMTFTVASGQTTYLVIAGFNHYGLLSYGATYMAFAATGPSGPTTNVINNAGTSLGGTWSISQTSQTQLTVAKSAGSYNGGGYWFVHILSST